MKGMSNLIKLLLVVGSLLTLELMSISSVLINKPAAVPVRTKHRK